MSVLGDRIIEGHQEMLDAGLAWWSFGGGSADWAELRQELIDLRAQAAAYVDRLSRDQAACPRPAAHMEAEWRGEWPPTEDAAPVAGGLRPCPICRTVKIGPTLVECTSCAGREDAAAKRSADQ